MEPLYFKQFLELSQVQPNYYDALKDELGISAKNATKSPDWGANMAMGDVSYNGMNYRVVRLVQKDGQVTGAMIEPSKNTFPTQKAFLNQSNGQQVRLPNVPSPKGQIFLPIARLNSLKTQGFTPGGQAGGGMM